MFSVEVCAYNVVNGNQVSAPLTLGLFELFNDIQTVPKELREVNPQVVQEKEVKGQRQDALQRAMRLENEEVMTDDEQAKLWKRLSAPAPNGLFQSRHKGHRFCDHEHFHEILQRNTQVSLTFDDFDRLDDVVLWKLNSYAHDCFKIAEARRKPSSGGPSTPALPAPTLLGSASALPAPAARRLASATVSIDRTASAPAAANCSADVRTDLSTAAASPAGPTALTAATEDPTTPAALTTTPDAPNAPERPTAPAAQAASPAEERLELSRLELLEQQMQQQQQQIQQLLEQQQRQTVNHNVDKAMTFEEKASLSAGINRLTSNNLAKVVKIIQKNQPSLGAGSEKIEVDINALDNRTLWELQAFVARCKAAKKKPKKRPAETADSRRRACGESLASTTQELMQVEAGLHAIEEPRGPQGIAFQQQDDDDSPADSASDSGSDDGGSALPIGAAGSSNGGLGGNQAWSDFANAKKQREREQQEQEVRQRRQQQQALLESQRARQQAHEQRDAQQRERDAQRAAERAQRETEEPAFDLLGQSNMMASFQGGGAGGDGDLDFGLDEYGGSALPIGAAGSSHGGLGGNQAWSDVANAPKQREREQQEEEARKRQRPQEQPVFRSLSSVDNPEVATAGRFELAEVAPEAAGAAGMAPNDGCRDDASDAGTEKPEDDEGAEDDIEDLENALPGAGVVMAVASGGGSP